jgi:hypothetical protein
VILTPSTASMWTYFPDAETLSLRTSGTQQTRALAEDIDTLLSQQDVVVVADRHRFEAFVDEEIRVLLLSRMVQVETKSDSMMLVLREYRETQ